MPSSTAVRVVSVIHPSNHSWNRLSMAKRNLHMNLVSTSRDLKICLFVSMRRIRAFRLTVAMLLTPKKMVQALRKNLSCCNIS